MEYFIAAITALIMIAFLSFVLFIFSYVPMLGTEVVSFGMSFAFLFVVITLLFLILGLVYLLSSKKSLFKYTIAKFSFWFLMAFLIMSLTDYVMAGVSIVWWLKIFFSIQVMLGFNEVA